MRILGGLLLLFAFLSVHSQSTERKDLVESHFTYSFSGATDQQQLDKLEQEMYQIKGITEVKINYKWDSGIGQLFCTRVSSPRIGETIEEFNPADIKRLISELGLAPVEFKEL